MCANVLTKLPRIKGQNRSWGQGIQWYGTDGRNLILNGSTENNQPEMRECRDRQIKMKVHLKYSKENDEEERERGGERVSEEKIRQVDK